ncbi:CoA transferase [Nocardioides sp. TF02-7]|uniref:CaiB/BaiF CoA transferase family protein n=1 Tax=Nocardioides sp. TF02-7 TaxID=2917724 RepID=UPI001F05B789|nr:CoA transferase [Nocardioides sp. TF02-7]UMG93715.1 CoA transferase [Nocardioides sp. TF02-7]
MPDGNGALQGVRVLDLGRVLAAPFAAQVLGDLGADVIKIERPGAGDIGRLYGRTALPTSWPAGGRDSSFFVSTNRNKRSVTVDLQTTEGRDVLRGLVAVSDVLIENFIGDTAERLGLDHASLAAVNDRLVHCSITGYGKDGPYAGRPGYDAVFQAHSGLMSVTGLPDDVPGGGPMKTGPSLVDVMTGLNAAIAVLAALSYRDRVSGKGQSIDVSLMDSAVASQTHLVSEYFLSGVAPSRKGNEGNGGGPAQVFECADGPLYVSAGSDAAFLALCKVLGASDLAEDPRFADVISRGVHTEELGPLLAERIAPFAKFELMDRLLEAEVPCSVVKDYDELFDDPHVRERGSRVDLAHPWAEGGSVPVLASPPAPGGDPRPPTRATRLRSGSTPPRCSTSCSTWTTPRSPPCAPPAPSEHPTERTQRKVTR